MKVIEVNAGTLNPLNALRDWGATEYVCRCLLIKTGAGVVAVDTGIGLRDIADPVARLGQDWLDLARPSLDPAEALVNQVKELGHHPTDVSDIVITHQHRDHIGGLADFPQAVVHALPSLRAAVRDAEWEPTLQWSHGVRWGTPPVPMGAWHGLDTFVIAGVDRRIRLVPLPGHSVGHAGVLVELDDGSFLLHVGDAAFHPTQYGPGTVPPGVAAFTRATQQDEPVRLATERVLADLHSAGAARIITAHGPIAPADKGVGP